MIFNEVERALGLLEEAESRIAEMQTSTTGTIRIGASDTIFEYFLADKIVEYHERFPAVNFELTADLTPATIEKLKADKCDVAFVNLPLEPDPELTLYGNCMRLNDVFIVGEKYKKLCEKTISLSELQKYPLVLMDGNTIARQAINSFFSSLGVQLKPSIEVESWDLMKGLVERGMGIGIIPREYAVRRLETGTLFELKTDPVLPARSVGMLLLKNAPVPYALHAFIEEFKKENR